MRARSVFLLACTVATNAACSEETPGLHEPLDSVPAVLGVIASEPITVVSAAGSIIAEGVTVAPRTAFARGAATQVSYISLPPGTASGGISARIRNATANTPFSDSITVFAGGFDPVPVPAAANDELEIAVSDGAGTITLLKASVPIKRPPRIVRTSPPRGRSDVAVKVVPTLVFSEPIDPQSLAGEVRLTTGGSVISASVAVSADAPWVVEIVPATPLQPLTTYQMTIRSGVRDLEGDPFGATETVTFSTGAALQLLGRLAFVSDRGGDTAIYLANGDGSGVVRLTRGDEPAWSPDGRQIVFERGSTSNGPFGRGAEIRLINADGSGDTWLTDGLEPAWSPDGSRIAFVDSAGISVINIDGSGLTRLIRHDVALGGTPAFRVGTPSWSSDGTRIAFEYSVEDFPQRIYVMNADGSQPGLLTPTSGAGEFAECHPSWSPDGEAIVLWNYDVGLAVMNASGAGALQRLFQAPLEVLSCYSGPAWSADGTAVTFALYAEDAARPGQRIWRGRIYVKAAATAAPPYQLIPDIVSAINPSYTDRNPAWPVAPR